jgi:hypothetical protein
LNTDSVHAVLVKLTSAAYHNLANPTYDKISEYLLASIAKKPNLVFIYDGLCVPDEIEETQPHVSAVGDENPRGSY